MRGYADIQYDLRSALQEVAPEQLAKERQALAKEIHELLMGYVTSPTNLPFQDNG